MQTGEIDPYQVDERTAVVYRRMATRYGETTSPAVIVGVTDMPYYDFKQITAEPVTTVNGTEYFIAGVYPPQRQRDGTLYAVVDLLLPDHPVARRATGRS